MNILFKTASCDSWFSVVSGGRITLLEDQNMFEVEVALLQLLVET